MEARRCLLVALFLGAALSGASAVEFDMVFQTKCVNEDVMPGEVMGSYSAFNRENRELAVPVEVRFEDAAANVVFEQRGNSQGDFHFIAAEEGEYKLCWTVADYATAQTTRLRLNWRSGSEAHDWEEVAKKDNLNAIQTEMLKLEQTVHDIHLELQSIRRQEERMRDLNERINTRVAWFSMLALLGSLGMAGWQLHFLQRFLKRKKVI